MTPPHIAAWFVALVLIAVGISHALHPRLWGDHLAGILRGPYAGLIIGLPTFITGLLILLAHPQWPPRPEGIVTVLGWAWALKGTLYLLWPALPQYLGERHRQHAMRLRWVGGAMIALGTAVAVQLIVTQVELD